MAAPHTPRPLPPRHTHTRSTDRPSVPSLPLPIAAAGKQLWRSGGARAPWVCRGRPDGPHPSAGLLRPPEPGTAQGREAGKVEGPVFVCEAGAGVGRGAGPGGPRRWGARGRPPGLRPIRRADSAQPAPWTFPSRASLQPRGESPGQPRPRTRPGLARPPPVPAGPAAGTARSGCAGPGLRHRVGRRPKCVPLGCGRVCPGCGSAPVCGPVRLCV